MVMFNNLNNILGDGQQPRKTDTLLQPTEQLTQPQQSSQATNQPANTAINQSTAPNSSGNQQQAKVQDAGTAKQTTSSPSAVVNANQDVKIENPNFAKAKQNADTIAQNQATAAEAYKPQATNYQKAAQDYISGATAEYKPQEVQKYTADSRDLDKLSIGLGNTADSGLNRLDAIIGRNSGTYGQSYIDAQQAIAAAQKQVADQQAQADIRFKAASEESANNKAKLPEFLKQQQGSLEQSVEAQRQAALARRAQEIAQEREADTAIERELVAELADKLNRQGLRGFFNQEAFDNSNPFANERIADPVASTVMNPEQLVQLNRILELQGLAPQGGPDGLINLEDMYQSGYDQAARKQLFDGLLAEAIAAKAAAPREENNTLIDGTLGKVEKSKPESFNPFKKLAQIFRI